MTDENKEEQVSDNELAQEGMLEALVEEIKERALLSKTYKEERDAAKTEVKRNHFHKKLIRNNEESADLLVALERMVEARDRRNGTDGNVEGDAEAPSTTEESSD